MLRDEKRSEEETAKSSNSDAEFIGWQENLHGENFPLYNITATNHPLRGSTVSEKSLNELNLQVPGVPPHNVHAKRL